MRYRVKKRWTVLGVAIVAAVGIFIVKSCFLEADNEGYRSILERANPALAMESNQAYRASQQRKGVQKEFWHMKGGQRLEAVLKCSETELVYEKEGESQVVVENMKDVRCFLQEELYFLSPDGKKTFKVPRDAPGYIPEQTVRYVVAETAKYHYTTETLDGNGVTMCFYTFPGHKLPRSVDGSIPTRTGEADRVCITMINKTVNFDADKFKGTIF